MAAAFSSPDSPYTRLCAVWSCRCGATLTEVGRHAGELPPGWERLDDGRCLCAHCAAVRREPAAAAAPPR